ncbi:hypothetical protein CGRA01v4_07170 [Colletotrichum graminicola]|nr:hypothetical protein CGRA01v4_07170 [Colletotrichum graminicola]
MRRLRYGTFHTVHHNAGICRFGRPDDLGSQCKVLIDQHTNISRMRGQGPLFFY